ncbi:MAG: helix-turn-helix domain-containing protein [Chloroflexota bacterium]
MTEELEGHITVNEAARKMGRSTEQVRRYLREGRLPGKRIGGQWFIRETAVLYRTRQEETREMMRRGPDPTGELPGVDTRGRMDVFERINGRREEIRRRWESMGISVDAAELVREIREEER